MVRDEGARYGPFGGLRVERTTKDDGRYVLYYTWPADDPSGARDGTTDSTGDVTPRTDDRGDRGGADDGAGDRPPGDARR